MKITKGRQEKPVNLILSGVAGIGKSTFGASMPNPIFIGGEEHDDTDSHSLPQAKKMKDIDEQMKWLLTEKHGYQTLVIDTLDSVETLVHKKILASDSKQTGAMAKCHGGYGAGYDMAEKEMIKFKDKCKTLRDEKGMNLLFLCHTKTKKTTDPVIGADYDEFKLWLHEKAEAVFVDWVSAALFATYITHKTNDSSKFATGQGQRIILTEKRPGYLAKNRYELPYEMEMPIENPAGPFMEGVKRFYAGAKRPEEQVRQSVVDLITALSDTELKSKANEQLNKTKTYQGLVKLEERLKVMMT